MTSHVAYAVGMKSSQVHHTGLGFTHNEPRWHNLVPQALSTTELLKAELETGVPLTSEARTEHNRFMHDRPSLAR